jgi:23S rRNA (uracil1939-C5)-methyltransferase
VNCRHFGVCGGCSLPGVPYLQQLRRKREQLQRWFPGISVAPITASPADEAFRHKVAFVFEPQSSGTQIVMGHYQAGSSRVIPVEECPVHSRRGNALAFALRDRLARAHVPPGILRHVLARTSADEREVSLMLVVTENHKSLRVPIRGLLNSAERPDGFFLNINDRPGPYMVGRKTMRLDGRSHVREDMLGASFLISPAAFFQTNVLAARELLQLVLMEVGLLSPVLDLYSGGGLFTIPLARGGTHVAAVEENRDAVGDAAANLRLNRIPSSLVRLMATRAEDAIAALQREVFEAVILDPPRQGCPDAVLDGICRLEPQRIVYVSCNPEKLALERRRLQHGGYRLARLHGVDMFPHTNHIEAVAVFEPV